MGLLKGFQLVFSRQFNDNQQFPVNSLQPTRLTTKHLISNRLTSKILKPKTKASSLMEVIVASVIIVVIFGIVTLTLNNIIQNNFRTKTDVINNHLNKVVYLYQNGKIEIPFQENVDDWEIQSKNSRQKNRNYVVFTATHQKTKKEISKKVLNEN